MTLAANQPYFLPYFPYWQLIHAADRFLVADDYAFIRHGWITRNRIRMGEREIYLLVELQQMSRNKLISQLELAPLQVDKKLRTVETAPLSFSRDTNFSSASSAARRKTLPSFWKLPSGKCVPILASKPPLAALLPWKEMSF